MRRITRFGGGNVAMETMKMILEFSLLLMCSHMWIVCGSVPYLDVKSDYEALLAAYEMPQTGQRHDVIPKNFTTGRLDVFLDLRLHGLVDFDVVGGTLELAGTLYVEWIDEIKELTGTTFTQSSVPIAVTKDQVWVPDLVLINSQSYDGKLGDKDDVIQYNTSTGECKWEILLAVKIACTSDVTYFPYDAHECQLVVRTWLHEDPNIELNRLSETLNTDSLEPSALWDITKTAVTRSNMRPHDIKFGISVKRKPNFLAAMILTPILVISVLSLFSFMIPPFSEERVTFSATCFLSYVILLQYLTDIIPTVFFPISLVCLFSFFMLLLNVIICIVNVIILRIHFGKQRTKIPDSLKAFIRTITFRPCFKDPQGTPPLLERQDTVFNMRFAVKSICEDLNDDIIEEIDERDSVFEDDDAVIIETGQDENELHVDVPEREGVPLHQVKSIGTMNDDVMSIRDNTDKISDDNEVIQFKDKVEQIENNDDGDKIDLESISSVDTTFTTRSVVIKPTLTEEVYTRSFNTYLPPSLMSQRMRTRVRHDIVGGRPRSSIKGRKRKTKTDITPVEHSILETLPKTGTENIKEVNEVLDTQETTNDDSYETSEDRKDSGMCEENSKVGTSVSDSSELACGSSRTGKNDSDDGRTTVTRFSSSTKTNTRSTSSVSHKEDEMTWSYVGHILDNFVMLLFAVVQTIFILAFVLPITTGN